MVQITLSTLKTLLITLGPFLLPRLLASYRSYRTKSTQTKSTPVRPLPSHLYRSLNILFLSTVLSLLSTLPYFAPENIFTLTSSRIQTPNDVLFTRLALLRPNNTLTSLDHQLKPRIASLDARCLYLQYGPEVLTHCPFCLSDEPFSYFWYALPGILYPHILHFFALGAATSSAIARKEGSRWRNSAVLLGVGLAVADCWITGSRNWKANTGALRAEDLDHFFWGRRVWRGVGFAVADVVFAGFMWVAGTNRWFVVPPTAGERMEGALKMLEGARGRMAALGIVRNVVVRDEGLRRRGEGYWRKEGAVMAEVLEEREVVEGIRGALGSGRISVSQVEEDAKRYAEGIVGPTDLMMQQPQQPQHG
ncbi:MAG: hypothetical protein L6R36_003901 [Xanthoria steineri]|nr:MAG: hypothetical protein L6R36_003901 [Xanthoria steineri]